MKDLIFGRRVYTVERNTKDDNAGRRIEYAYTLRGPRGSEYVLLRNMNDPTLLFPVNARNFTSSVPFQWVREHEDHLEVIR